MKKLLISLAALIISGCATLTEDAMTPIVMSFSNGSNGSNGRCELSNERGLRNTGHSASRGVAGALCPKSRDTP